MPDKLSDFKKLKGRERTLVVGLIIVIGFGIYIQLIHKPLANKTAQFKFQIEKSKARLENLRTKFPQIDKQKETIESLNAECEDFLEEIGDIEKTVPSKENIAQLLSEFTRLAKDVELLSIKQKIQSGEEYSRLFIELKFNTSYQGAVKYIKNIESISPFLLIEEMEISEPRAKTTLEGVPVRLMVSSLLGQAAFVETLKAIEVEEVLSETRDIFISKTKPVTKAADIDLTLEGITFNAETPTAIINDDVVKVSSKVGKLTVKQILPDTVILTDGVKDHVLLMER